MATKGLVSFTANGPLLTCIRLLLAHTEQSQVHLVELWVNADSYQGLHNQIEHLLLHRKEGDGLPIFELFSLPPHTHRNTHTHARQRVVHTLPASFSTPR